MRFEWPPGFARIPDDDWTRTPVESLALKYDTVENHGWYANLDPTVAELSGFVDDGDVLVDYSGGTGILIDRLLVALRNRSFGVVNVDSSPKFLRLSLEKAKEEERVAFRLIRYLKDAKRLQYVHEVLDAQLLMRGVDGVVSTNAIHLYYDLDETLRSWARILRPDGRLFVQSGNVSRPGRPTDRWIIDDTVEAIHREAMEIVLADPAWRHHRPVLSDPRRMAAYDALRRKYFLPVRPLGHYVSALERAGFRVDRVAHHPIQARTVEWFEFLAVYHEGVLGWVGGVEKVDGRTPGEPDLRERLVLMRQAMDRVFAGADAFAAEWTYLTCRAPGG